MFLKILNIKQKRKMRNNQSSETMIYQISKSLEICDSALFPVANNQISIHLQFKILTSCKHQQKDFNFIKFGCIWIFTRGICPLKTPLIKLESKFQVDHCLFCKILHKNKLCTFMYFLFLIVLYMNMSTHSHWVLLYRFMICKHILLITFLN